MDKTRFDYRFRKAIFNPKISFFPNEKKCKFLLGINPLRDIVQKCSPNLTLELRICTYCMSKKSWRVILYYIGIPILLSNLQYQKGQDFLDRQYKPFSLAWNKIY